MMADNRDSATAFTHLDGVLLRSIFASVRIGTGTSGDRRVRSLRLSLGALDSWFSIRSTIDNIFVVVEPLGSELVHQFLESVRDPSGLLINYVVRSVSVDGS